MKKNKLNFISLLCFTLTILFSTFLGINVTKAQASSNDCTICGGSYINGICNYNSSHYETPYYNDNDDCYEIANAGNLMKFSKMVTSNNNNLNATLVNNIDAYGVSFNPIGQNYSYSGIFNGNGYSITNLSIFINSNAAGLFGNVNNGIIKNLTIQGNISQNHQYNQYVGLLAGIINNSIIYNCKVIGSITNNNTSSSSNYNVYLGGIIGSSKHSVIINSASEVDIYSTVNQPGSACIGGIVGAAVVEGDLPDCILNSYSTSTIQVKGNSRTPTSNKPDAGYFIGGIAGYLNDDAINNYYYGNIIDLDTNSKTIGYAFGKINPNFSYGLNSGNIIVRNNYYPLGQTAIGNISDSSYNTTDSTTGLPEVLLKSNLSIENSLISLLNNNKSQVDEIIITNRDILGNKTWGELNEKFNIKDIHSFDWILNNSTSLPTLQDHIFGSNGYCIVCENECKHYYDDCNDFVCNICYKISLSPNHIYDSCDDTNCNVCNHTREALEHQYLYCDSTICEICGHKRTALLHSYNDCDDTSCNICNKVRIAPGHKTQDCSSTICIECGKSNIQPVHIYDDCEDINCNICSNVRTAPGHIYDNCEDVDCEICLKTRTPSTHIYDDCDDTSCNNCYIIREPIPHIVDNCLDNQCNICLKENIPPVHMYDNCEDTICNTCNFTRIAPGHEYTNCEDPRCNKCSNVRIPAEHYFEYCDSTKCSNCPVVRTPLPHNWNYANNPPNCTNCDKLLTIKCTSEEYDSYYSTFPQITGNLNYATFTLLTDIQLSNSITIINNDANITIDLNGFTISTTATNEITSGLFVTNSDQNIINIIDSSTNKTGSIDYSGNLIDGLGKLNIVNCKFPNGIYVNNINTLASIKNENSCYNHQINEELTEFSQSITIGQHSYISNTILPTCTQNGYTTHTCLNCNDSYTTNTVSSLGHTIVIVPAVEPTCTTFGKTQGSYCSVCKETLVKQTHIDKLGHSYSVNYSNDDESHWHACINKGCDKTINSEKHIDKDKNNYCDVCNYLINKTFANNNAYNNVIGSSKTALIVLGIAGVTLFICLTIILRHIHIRNANKKLQRKSINNQSNNTPHQNQTNDVKIQTSQQPKPNTNLQNNNSQQAQQSQQMQQNNSPIQTQGNSVPQQQVQDGQNNKIIQQNQGQINQQAQTQQQAQQIHQQKPLEQNSTTQNNQPLNTQGVQNNQNTNSNNNPPKV